MSLRAAGFAEEPRQVWNESFEQGLTNAASGLPAHAGGRYTAPGGRQVRWHLPVVPLLVALAIIAGAALLLHPMTAAWFTSVEQSREIDKLTQGINDLGAETLHQRLTEAREYNRNLSGDGAAVAANERLPLADEPRPDNAPDHSSMLRGTPRG